MAPPPAATPIKTTCAYCGVGCGIRATVTAERSLAIEGDLDHPANRGKLCTKGTHLGETVGLEGRLLHPLIGDTAVGWNEALDAVATRMRDTIEAHGPDSVAFYVSGQLLTEDYYVVNKLAKGFVGTGNIDTNSRLCMSSAVVAHNRAFGEDVVPCSYEDLDAADLIVLVGSNTAWCHPVIWQRIEAARERRGTKLVVIDPRRTETAQRAELHVPVAPDGDVALFTALLAELGARGLVDEAFLAEHVSVPDRFWDTLPGSPTGREGAVPADDARRAGDIERVPPADWEIGGVDGATFRALADLVAAHPRMVTLFSMGANQSVSGTDKGNAIINLHLATGRINAPGAGPFSITGQPNAMGGREVGGLANMLACHLGFSEPERAAVARFWNSPRLCSGPGLKAVELFEAVHAGRIKFIWIMATNPAVSMPDAGFVREALGRCPTVVVSDVIADTDTGRLAHVRLPALAWGEKDGTVTNSERRISRQRALFPAPGAARADWRIVCDVAGRLGHGAAFAFARPADVFREFAAMTALATRHGKQLDLTAWSPGTDEEYEAMAPFQWGGRHPFSAGFSTQDRRARMIAVAAPRVPAPEIRFPLRLNTGRYRDQWHTMTRTGLSPRLSHHRREPLLEIHPDDARRYGLPEAGLARVTTAHGGAVFRVAHSEGQRRGEIFVPMHWTDAMSSAGRANRLTRPRTDPHSGQPGFKDTPATVEPVEPAWHGFLVTREQPTPTDLLYWTRSRIGDGWLYELAGDGTIDAAALLPAGERLEAADPVRGMRRIAVRAEGQLAAALYVTRGGRLPAREWVSGELGRDRAATSEILAGRPSLPAMDSGSLVCVCHGVGERTVIGAIQAGAATVAAIGERTCAGTNCGSCRPHLAALLEALANPIAEAAE